MINLTRPLIVILATGILHALAIPGNAILSDQAVPEWFGRTAPSQLLGVNLSDLGYTDRTGLERLLNAPNGASQDEALRAYIDAFQDDRQGRLLSAVDKLTRKADSDLKPYDIDFLCVSSMIGRDPSHPHQAFGELAFSRVRDKSARDVVHSPLGELLLTSCLCQESYRRAESVAADCCKSFPKIRACWDCFAWDCETGSMSNGKTFDPLSSAFDFRTAVRVRQRIAHGWPDDDSNWVDLARDLDMIGKKSEATEIAQKVVARHTTDDDVRKNAVRALKYFNNGGWKQPK